VLCGKYSRHLRNELVSLGPSGKYKKELFQGDRADNVLAGSKQEMMEKIRADIRDFKEKKNLDKVS